MKTAVVIGMGETGKPLYDILSKVYDVFGYDLKMGDVELPKCCFLHICIPYQIEDFVGTVKFYQEKTGPELTIIHSTVPIGTTSSLPDAVHSPILGDHTNMGKSLAVFPKWVGGPLAHIAAEHLAQARMECIVVATSEETEALKLMCLAKYGMSIAFAQYQQELCDKYNFSYDDVLDWDTYYNSGVHYSKRRPIIFPPGKSIGGHCVVPGTKILNEQHPNRILQEVLSYA